MATTGTTPNNTVDAQLASMGGDLQRLHGNYRSSWTRTLGHMGAVHVAQQRQEHDLGAMALLETHAAWHARSMRDSQEAHHANVKRFVDAVELANGGGTPVDLPPVQVDEVIDEPAPAPAPAAPSLTLTEAPAPATTTTGQAVALAPVVHDDGPSASSITGHVDDYYTDLARRLNLKTPQALFPIYHIEDGEDAHDDEADKNKDDNDDLDRVSTVAQPPRPRDKVSAAVKEFADTLPVIQLTTSNFCWAYSNGRCNDIECPRGLMHGCISCYKRKKAYDHPWCMGAGGPSKN